MMTMLKLFESKTTTSLTTGSPKLLMLSQKVVKYLVSTLHHHLPYIISGDKDSSGGWFQSYQVTQAGDTRSARGKLMGTVEKNPVSLPNCRALDWSVVLAVGQLCPIVPQ